MKSPHLVLRAFVQLSLTVAVVATPISFADDDRQGGTTAAENAAKFAADRTEEFAKMGKKTAEDLRAEGNEEEAKKWEERAKMWEEQAKEFREAQSAAKFAGDAVRSGNKLAERAAKYQINKEISKVMPGGEVPPAVKSFIDNNLVEAAAAGNAYKSFKY